MMKTFVLTASLLLLTACGGGSETSAPTTAPAADIALTDPASASAWAIDREASSIRFMASQNGNNFEGGFSRWDAAIAMDLEDPGNGGSIEARVDLGSADAGTSERNEALPGKEWFHISAFPVAIFSSDVITITGPGTYEAQGTLTIKGITDNVTMPFTLEVDQNGRAIADGSVMLNRSLFNVGEGEFASGQWVGLDVDVMLHIEANPAE